MDEPYYSVPKLHGGGRSGSTKEQFFNTGFKETSATISHKMGSSIKMSVMECDQYSYDSTPWKKTTIRASKADPCSMAAKTWVSDDITVKEETSNGSPLKNEFGEFESSEIVCVESEYLLESSKLFLDKPTSTCETNYANEKSSEKESEQVEFKQEFTETCSNISVKSFSETFSETLIKAESVDKVEILNAEPHIRNIPPLEQTIEPAGVNENKHSINFSIAPTLNRTHISNGRTHSSEASFPENIRHESDPGLDLEAEKEHYLNMLEFTRARDARILAASTTPCMSLSKNVSDYYQNIWHEPSPYTSIQRLPDYNTERTKVGNICGPLTTHGSHNQPLEEPPATPGNERKFPREIMASTRVLRSSRRNEIFKSCSKKTQHDKSLNGSGFNHVRSCVFDENILSPSRELLNHKRFRTTTASQSQSRKTRLQQNRSKPPCNGSRKRNASVNVIGKEQRIKSHVCSVCSKRFISPSQLNRHYRTHTGEKPYRCDVCKKNFSQEKSLKYHTELHTGGNRYICGICKRSLSSSSNLTGHMSIHTGEMPYTCEICQKKFRRNQFLTQHMITHTGERPYSCDVCEKKFARKITVTYHMRTHVSKKRDEVNDQEKLPKRPDMTKFSGVDKGEKPYECSFCEAKFSRQSKLTTHLRKHTG